VDLPFASRLLSIPTDPFFVFLQQKSSTDDARYAVKPFTLTVSAFHRSNFGKIHTLRHPAFRAVGKRWGFYKFPTYTELAAMNAEPAVLHGFFFFCKALHFPLKCRKNPDIFFSHGYLYHLLLLFSSAGYYTHEYWLKITHGE
jgi:hypothetical protein